MKYLGEIVDDKDLVNKEYVDSMAGGGSKNMWYATCPTGTSTTAKVVSTDTGDFTLTTGNMLRVVFTNANSASAPTLKVDDLTAKNVRVVTGSSGAQYQWQAGETVDFVYNGTYFLLVNRAIATTTYYGVTKLTDDTNSSSTTTAVTPYSVKLVNDSLKTLGSYQDSGEKTNTIASSTSWQVPSTAAQLTLTSGTWLLIGFASYASNSTRRRGIRLYRTSGTAEAIASSNILVAPNPDGLTNVQTVAIVQHTGSQTYRVECIQYSGSQLSTTIRLQAVRLSV